MNTNQLLKSSLRSLLHHKGRSLLTTLGINIGIAAIIAMLAIGHGAEEKIKREILSTGKNMIYVHSGNLGLDPQQRLLKRKRMVPLTLQDIRAIRRACPSISKISPTLQQGTVAKYLQNAAAIELKAGNEELLTIFNRTIGKGNFFTFQHVANGARIIVLGHKAAKELFKTINPLGKLVTINNIPFVVIGVVAKLEHQFQGDFQDANLDCFIPATTFKKFIERSMTNKIKAFSISAKSYDAIPETVNNITKILRMRHRLELKDPNDFFIIDQQAMLKAAQASANILTIFLLIIALISLLVGGIGVMNIMLVSVGERTQEIGIRMALGAPNKTILNQFLYEALMLCCLGGILGVLLGLAVPWIASIFTGWSVVIKPATILIAVSAIFCVGIIFGYYPARKAASLNPVDALLDQ